MVERILREVWPLWHVSGVIGQGSYGKVYKIDRDDEISGHSEAALKVISVPRDLSDIETALTEGMTPDDASVYFFSIAKEIAKEFIIMEKFKGNTNIVDYEDHAVIKHKQDPGWDILIRMELLRPITEEMRIRPFTEREVIKIGLDLCTALELCAKNNIIHRDIKPENIFISKKGDYKLGDFGVARALSVFSKKGTFAYMAPEVFRGDHYDAGADIYSLGLVLYRLLNDNREPFLPPAPAIITFASKEEAFNKRMEGNTLPKPANASDEMYEIIKKACAYNPAERYLSAADMKKALIACLQRKESKTKEKQIKTVPEEKTRESVPIAHEAITKNTNRNDKQDVKNSEIRVKDKGKEKNKTQPIFIFMLLVLLVTVCIAVSSINENLPPKVEGISIKINNGDILRDSAVVEGLKYRWDITIKTDKGNYSLENAKKFLTEEEFRSINVVSKDDSKLKVYKTKNKQNGYVVGHGENKTKLTIVIKSRGQKYKGKKTIYVYPNAKDYRDFNYKVEKKEKEKTKCSIYYEDNYLHDKAYYKIDAIGVDYKCQRDDGTISSFEYNDFVFEKYNPDKNGFVYLYFLKEYDNKESSFAHDVLGAMQIPIADLFEFEE